MSDPHSRRQSTGGDWLTGAIGAGTRRAVPGRSPRTRRRGATIENSSARSLPCSTTSALARRRSRSTRSSAAGQRDGVAGLDEQRVDAVGGDVAVAVERAGDHRRARRHRLDQHDAERLAVQRRCAERPTPPRRRANFSALVDRDPATRSAASPPYSIRSRSVSARRRRPSTTRRRRAGASPGAAPPSPLRSSWRPRKKIAGRS